MHSKHDGLPVSLAREKILNLINENHVTILVGETGSGKTTKVPQFILDSHTLSNPIANFRDPSKRARVTTCPRDKNTRALMIGITQPRRVAAISVSKFVSTERRNPAEVGYSVRFDDNCTGETRIKYMTDGILMREIHSDPTLSRYGVVILDEAHERSLQGDILFCMLKHIMLNTHRHNDLRVIIMSAAMEIDHFCEFWNKPIRSSYIRAESGHESYHSLRVTPAYLPGRQHPVSIRYISAPVSNYVRAAVEVSVQIIISESKNLTHTKIGEYRTMGNSKSSAQKDILIFFTGQQEIEDAYKILCQKRSTIPKDLKRVMDFHPLRLYGGMTKEEQSNVVSPTSDRNDFSLRKIIVASNIAETSLTIPGVTYVIDSGLVKQKWYNPTTHTDELRIVPICKAQAIQRAGRAGREGPGKCYRLYTEDYFWNMMHSFSKPEMTRCSPLSVILHLKNIGVTSVCKFDFIDPPNQSALIRALETLHLLSALDEFGKITTIGKQMAGLPLEPMASRTLLKSFETKCGRTIETVTTILAVLSVDGISQDYSKDNESMTRQYSLPQRLASEGDHFLYYDLLSHFRKLPAEDRKRWCKLQHVRYSEMNKAVKIRSQLLQEAKKLGANLDVTKVTNIDDVYRGVRVSFCAGYFSQIAEWDSSKRAYIHTATGSRIHLSPSSVLTGSKAPHPLLLFGSLLFTSKSYMRDVLVITEDALENGLPKGN